MELRSEPLAMIAEQEAKAKKFDQARKTVEEIRCEKFQSKALAAIARYEAEDDKLDKAKETAIGISHQFYKDKTLAMIAEHEAKKGNFKEAEEQSKNITSPYFQCKALLGIAKYNSKDRSTTLLTKEGYCVGPSYCSCTNKLAFSKRINEVMQLCVYDIKRGKETQLAFDLGNKIDCSWSPCGRYIVFCYQRKRTRRIVVIHVAMKQRTYITPAHAICSCPAWSPVYGEVPVVS